MVANEHVPLVKKIKPRNSFPAPNLRRNSPLDIFSLTEYPISTTKSKSKCFRVLGYQKLIHQRLLGVFGILGANFHSTIPEVDWSSSKAKAIVRV